MAANGEEPLHRMAVDDIRGLRHEFDERVLDHIPGPIRVAEKARRVPGERSLLRRKRPFQETGVFMPGNPGVLG